MCFKQDKEKMHRLAKITKKATLIKQAVEFI